MKQIKVFISFLLFISIGFNAYSQFRLEFVSFSEDPTDIRVRTQPRKDLNGDPTALLKIQIPMLQDARISSPLKVGNEDLIPGEFLIYLGEGSKRITVNHSDFEPFEYTFDTPLKGKTAYKLVLKVPTDYISLGMVSVKINTNVLDASLNINGESYHTDNGQFLLKLKKGEYSYCLSTTKSGYGKLEGNFYITENDLNGDGRIDQYFELQSDKKSNLHISFVEGSNIRIDGKEVGKIKGAISLPLGRHYVDVSLSGYKKSFMLDLLNENEYLNADIRVPMTIVSPSIAKYTIKPLDNALKPSLVKFNAGDEVRILGSYQIIAEAKGYEMTEFEVSAFPEMAEMRITVPMTSNAHNLFNGTYNVQQINKAYKAYLNLIKVGDEVAMWEYGNILVKAGNQADGNRYIKNAADKGHPQAAVYTAANLEKDNNSKIKYLNIALNAGEQSAHQFLGDLYSQKAPVDYVKAYDEYSLYNSPYSRIRRAEIAIGHNNLIKADYADIIALLESVESSDINYALAQNILGEMAFKGLGMSQNIDNAVAFWSKCPPNILSQEALLILDVYYMNDDNLKKYLIHTDMEKITEDKIIYKGITVIQFLVRAAQILDKKDTYQAYTLLKKAYDFGDRSRITVSYLGKYYMEGKVTGRNLTKAKELLNIGVEQYDDVLSMRWLGFLYEKEKDYASAERYYKKAISLNDILSKGMYATLLYNKGKQYYSEAESLWTEAANLGHKSSIKRLIQYYESVKHDSSKAAYWKKKL